MAQSQNAMREIFVVDALAAETTLNAFEASASDGEIGIFNADGSDGTSKVGGFLLAMKVNGKTVVSDTYKSEDVQTAFAKGYEAPVLRSITVTPTNLTVGQEYVLNLRILNFGSLSAENYYTKHAQYVVQTGDTAANVVSGLITSLNKNFSREEGSTASTNTAFTFTGTTTLIITEKDQPYSLGKNEGRQIPFDVFVDEDSSGLSMADIVTTAGGSPGVGTGKQVALMEYFYRGNRGDGFGYQHFPYNWGVDTKTNAIGSEEYGLIELKAISKHDTDFNVSTSRKEVTIACPMSASVIAINAIINKLEAVITQTIPDLV